MCVKHVTTAAPATSYQHDSCHCAQQPTLLCSCARHAWLVGCSTTHWLPHLRRLACLAARLHSCHQHECPLPAADLQDQQVLCAQGARSSGQHMRAQGADALRPTCTPQQAQGDGTSHSQCWTACVVQCSEEAVNVCTINSQARPGPDAAGSSTVHQAD